MLLNGTPFGTVHSFTEYILKHKEVEDLEKRIEAIEERLEAQK